MPAHNNVQPTGGISGEDWARADFYALLSRLYAGEIDKEFVAKFAQLDIDEIDQTSPLGFEFAELVRQIRGHTINGINSEYDDVFIGVGKPDILLYGSYYLAGFLNEKPLVALRDDLAKLGLQPDASLTETEDHLAFLSEVMRYLILADDPPVPIEDQIAFFRSHIASWYGQVCDAIENSGKTNFYKTVGRMTRVFFDVETQSFDFESTV